jgi:hypothetical protein
MILPSSRCGASTCDCRSETRPGATTGLDTSVEAAGRSACATKTVRRRVRVFLTALLAIGQIALARPS